MLNLRDREAVVQTLDDALRSCERGGAVPVGVRELLLEFSETLAESTPYEAGRLSGPELVLARNGRRAVSRGLVMIVPQSSVARPSARWAAFGRFTSRTPGRWRGILWTSSGCGGGNGRL